MLALTTVITGIFIKRRRHWCHAIVCNHGFADGNKRTSLYLVELLVQRSGYEFVEDDDVIADMVVSVARSDTGCEDLAEWFRERLVRSGKP